MPHDLFQAPGIWAPGAGAVFGLGSLIGGLDVIMLSHRRGSMVARGYVHWVHCSRLDVSGACGGVEQASLAHGDARRSASRSRSS
jgi:hypothetical protein